MVDISGHLTTTPQYSQTHSKLTFRAICYIQKTLKVVWEFRKQSDFIKVDKDVH